MRGSRWFRCTVPVLVIVLATVGLGACRGSQEPSPRRISPGPETLSSTPSPSPSPSLDEQALIDEAIAALTDYLALANEVENAGGEGWEEKLKPWWGSQEVVELATAHFLALEENDWHTEGRAEIVSITSAELARTGVVHVRYCLDASEARALDSSGVEVAVGPTENYPATADLERSDEQWILLSQRSHWDIPC